MAVLFASVWSSFRHLGFLICPLTFACTIEGFNDSNGCPDEGYVATIYIYYIIIIIKHLNCYNLADIIGMQMWKESYQLIYCSLSIAALHLTCQHKRRQSHNYSKLSVEMWLCLKICGFILRSCRSRSRVKQVSLFLFRLTWKDREVQFSRTLEDWVEPAFFGLNG